MLETTKEEWIRSPHYSSSEISLHEVQSDVSRSEDERELVCPEAELPIFAEKLLMRAGIAHFTLTSDSNGGNKRNGAPYWSNFGPSLASSSSSLENGSGVKGTRPILHLLTKPPIDSTSSSLSLDRSEVYAKFEELLVHLGGDIGKVSRVYAIDHPSLRVSFENHHIMLTAKQADSGTSTGEETTAPKAGVF